jgi:DivIVA domain-containing protein
VLYVWLVVGLAVVVTVVLVALGRGDAAAPAEPDGRAVVVPEDRPMTAADVAALRFPQAVRGYRVDAVDGVLDRLAAELRHRDALLTALGHDVGAAAPVGGPEPVQPPRIELTVPLPGAAADTAPAGLSDTAPAGLSDTAPAGLSDTAPAGLSDTAPAAAADPAPAPTPAHVPMAGASSHPAGADAGGAGTPVDPGESVAEPGQRS